LTTLTCPDLLMSSSLLRSIYRNAHEAAQAARMIAALQKLRKLAVDNADLAWLLQLHGEPMTISLFLRVMARDEMQLDYTPRAMKKVDPLWCKTTQRQFIELAELIPQRAHQHWLGHDTVVWLCGQDPTITEGDRALALGALMRLSEVVRTDDRLESLRAEAMEDPEGISQLVFTPEQVNRLVNDTTGNDFSWIWKPLSGRKVHPGVAVLRRLLVIQKG
jgi:hypothetical protein